jgi:hypothetical protein
MLRVEHAGVGALVAARELVALQRIEAGLDREPQS